MPILQVCRSCGADCFVGDENDDLCYDCHQAPVEDGFHDGEYACMNCGAHYTYSPAGPIGFCSTKCSASAHSEIVAYGRFN